MRAIIIIVALHTCVHVVTFQVTTIYFTIANQLCSLIQESGEYPSYCSNIRHCYGDFY